MTQEALKLALEYIQAVPDDRYNAEHIDRDALITAIKETLAQTQELVAWLCKPDENGLFGLPTSDKSCKDCFPVYRHSQREWVGLTDDEQQQAYEQWQNEGWGVFYNAIEAELKEKNT
jgi:hypothetical protein